MTVAIILIAVLVPFAFLAAIVGMAQGRLTALRNSARNAWRRVDEQLARRHGQVRKHLDGAKSGDLKEALDRAEEARSAIETALEDREAAAELVAAEAGLDSTLADDPLPEEERSGDRLAFAGEIYNDTVFRYSQFRCRLAARFTAWLFGFPRLEEVHFTSASEGGE